MIMLLSKIVKPLMESIQMALYVHAALFVLCKLLEGYWKIHEIYIGKHEYQCAKS